MIDAQYYMEWAANTDTSSQNCWTFVSKVVRENFGIELPRLNKRKSVEEQHLEAIHQHKLSGDWREVSEPRAGDLILIMLRRTRPHIGVMLDRNTFLHFSEVGRTVKRDRHQALTWRNRVEGFYRHRTS